MDSVRLPFLPLLKERPSSECEQRKPASQETAVLAQEHAVVLDLSMLQTQVTALHTDMVAWFTTLQESLELHPGSGPTALEASVGLMDQKMDLHLGYVQDYQHQLC